MIQYTNEQLATVIAVPIVTILLVWTTAIFHKNRRKWGPYDIPIVAIVVLSIIRNLTVLSYTLMLTLNQGTFDIDYCGVVVWIFNSIHAFQASCLTTLAVIGLFSAKLQRKNQSVRQFLTGTHVVYHLFCLTTLCACVGVAAILARTDARFVTTVVFETNPCKFMPFDLDIKFNVFVIVLHAFLASISVVAFAVICYNHLQFKRNGFDYLKKSNSDLSDLSLGGMQHAEGKHFYDTYTIQRNGQLEASYYDQNGGHHGQVYQNGFCTRGEGGWNSDISNLSTTVSSTNSRRPCLAKMQEEAESRTGLETIHPVLIVCYLFYHIPLIVLSIYPRLISPWPVAGLALWLGLIQDVLIPVGLGFIDSRFCKWVSNVYRCGRNHATDKLPHVGLDGKFRPFGGSQPPSLDITQTHPDVRNNIRSLQTVEHRFPITNGSLYTSIDGRLPVIHNYRRHKDQRAMKIEQANNSQKAQDYANSVHQQVLQYCSNCEVDLCPSHSNLHHLSPHYINRGLNVFQPNSNLMADHNQLQKRISLSQESLRQHQNHILYRQEMNNQILKSSRNLIRLNKMRLSKSEDSLTEIQRNLRDLKQAPVVYQSSKPSINDCYSSSDEDYLTENTQNNQNFDSLSSKSCYSITTEANGDFEFYQNNEINNLGNNNDKNHINKCLFEEDPVIKFKPSNITKIEIKSPNHLSRNNSLIDVNHNLRITRSNSKRSLENFQLFVDYNDDIQNNNEFRHNHGIQRSNSYMTLEDRKRSKNKKLLRSNSKLSDCTQNIKQKIKSVEYLPSSNASTVYIEDVCYLNLNKRKNNVNNAYIGSVPDLKKIFISEYI